MSPRGESRSTQDRAGGLVTPGRIAVLVLAVLALVFIFENTRRVKIRLLIPEVTMPLYLALLAVFVVGLCCGYFLRRRNR
ncbi:LapA family protein [Streptomyces sp. NPDC048361]|uniref:LapA family protein n=1 Tax=Streptomyces sp. NPDC048361 TaxID=3154720 RepID=UPI0034359C9C